jgi:hypothetical protein
MAVSAPSTQHTSELNNFNLQIKFGFNLSTAFVTILSLREKKSGLTYFLGFGDPVNQNALHFYFSSVSFTG